jgi:hypothetical protein
VPYYDDVTLVVGARQVRLFGVPVDLSLSVDNVLDRDNLKPNVRTDDPRTYVQNHIAVTGRLRLSF